MKKVFLILEALLIATSLISTACCAKDKVWKPALMRFIEAVKTDDPNKIGDFIDYPLRRQNPLPSVKDKADFVARYDDIFDSKLKAAIIKSNVDDDWCQVGLRGIIFEDSSLIGMSGAIWFQDSEDGKLQALNYQSPREAELARGILEKERNKLYKALRDFKKNFTILETDKFIIRIDEMEDCSQRYAAWSKPKTMSDKPDIILGNGRREYYGSGGNHSYIFKNGKYFYVCSINWLRSNETPPANLSVFKKKGKAEAKNYDWIDHDDYEKILDAPAIIVRE